MIKTFKIGDFVTVCHNSKYDSQYTVESVENRIKYNGNSGQITQISDSHGMCFKVKFSILKSAWYEAEELLLN